LAVDISAGTTAPHDAPDDARCPRCGGGFHCGINDAAPCTCTCTQLRLSEATLGELRARYQGCLCLRCLQALAP
jgi:hypothetical protein